MLVIIKENTTILGVIQNSSFNRAKTYSVFHDWNEIRILSIDRVQDTMFTIVFDNGYTGVLDLQKYLNSIDKIPVYINDNPLKFKLDRGHLVYHCVRLNNKNIIEHVEMFDLYEPNVALNNN